MFEPERKSKRYVILIGVLIILGLVLAGAVKYTSRSGFCIVCHEMGPIYKTWQTSSHKSVECIKCHSDPGFAGLVTTKTEALREVYLHVTGKYKDPIQMKADTSKFTKRCLSCHKDIKGKGKPHNDRHFQVNMQCYDCHKGLVHDPKSNNKLPSRKICVKCHGYEITD